VLNSREPAEALADRVLVHLGRQGVEV